MNLKELSQAHFIKKEIELYKQELTRLREQGSSKEEIKEAKAQLEIKRKQLDEELARIIKYINSIPNSVTRQVFYHRFINNESWTKVALSIGGGNTAESVKKICYRYLQRQGKDASDKEEN